MRRVVVALLVTAALVMPAIVLTAGGPAPARPSDVRCTPTVLNLGGHGDHLQCTVSLPPVADPSQIDPAAVRLLVYDGSALLAKIPALAPCDPCVAGQDADGRVHVKYFFDRDETSHWIRLAFPTAGKLRGLQCLPEIEDEVLVAFEHGDLRFPYILQGIWSGCDVMDPTKR